MAWRFLPINLFVAEAAIFQESQVDTSAADALAPAVARSSVTMAIMLDKRLLVFQDEGFEPHVTLKMVDDPFF